jgi:hypothetical protein
MDDPRDIERAQECEETRVYAWRVEQLAKLGLSTMSADADASFVDWHEVARLVQEGLPARAGSRDCSLSNIKRN